MHAQKTRWVTGESVFPPLVIVSMTSAPESADVTMKTISRRMAIPDVTSGKGISCSISNNVIEALVISPANSPTPDLCWAMAVSPNAENQMMQIVNGASSTTEKYSRTVRPREMRAMNMPTKGDQDIHQAQ